MRKIYLASKSKARKELLKAFGIRFKVVSGTVKEARQRKWLSYPQLVKRNALKKAECAAAKLRHGIIIAADTIVVQDGRIFGKPKDLAEARRMLKRLTCKPQWVYSGVAVIDQDNNKTLLDYEKTTVFMDPLSDEEINAYFARVSPLDKAGGFDIRAKGAFFLRRIEGCFYNVVGLPIRKLYIMLKKLEVRVFLW